MLIIQLVFLQDLDSHYENAAESMSDDDKADFLKRFPSLLKILFDEEVIDEEVIFKWHAITGKGSAANALRAASKMFVLWLKTAEEEESSDEDE